MKLKTAVLVCLLQLSGFPLHAREIISLSGQWERWIGDQFHDNVRVPSSYPPIGVAVLRRTMELRALHRGEHALVRFEGIAYEGIVRINGKQAGTLGPWTRHVFDISNQAVAGTNQIEVEIRDWQVLLGPSGAWESYGGIVRDVYLEIRPDPYIDDARFQYTFNSDRS